MIRELTMSRVLVLAACLAFSACTFLNAPDGLPPFPVDAGLGDADSPPGDGSAGFDMNVDADVDAGTDAGPTCRAREICFNGDEVDDDCDGATDCADLDCAGNAACCTAGEPRLSEEWSAVLNGRWQAVDPSSDLGPNALSTDGALSFGVDGRIRSILPLDTQARCLPLALGARIEFEFERASCADADGGACDGEAAVLLTAADAPASGRSLSADLRVSVRGDRALSVTSGATSLLRSGVSVSDARRVVIEVSPVARDGVPVLEARVSLGPVGAEVEALRDAVFLPQDALRACPVAFGSAATLGGLRIAVEGRGRAVKMTRLEATPLACTNPVVFASAGIPITAAQLPAESAWNRGGIGAPAILPENDFQHLLYDAANVARDLEDVAPIDLAIGMADAVNFRSTTWLSRPMPSPNPPAYLGTTPPTCTLPGCVSPVSYREPTATGTWLPTGALSTMTYLLAFAHENARGNWEIGYLDALRGVNSSPGAMPATITPLVPAGGACASVRDPAFAQADVDPGDGLWLFYTCVPARGPSTLHAVTLQLSADMTTWSARPDTDVEVLGPSIGDYAARGVRGAAPLVRILPDAAPGMGGTLAVRIWFIARGADGRTTLSLAEGQRRLDVAATAASMAVPALVASPANPLLDGASDALGVCMGRCALEDVAVGRIPGAGATEVTLLLARRVDDPGGGTVRQFIPLGQTLEPRWWGTP